MANADGSFETVYEPEQPDIAALRSRIAEVLRGEGKLLHAANLLVRGKVLEREARDQLARERDLRAMAVVEHHQWVTAGTVFANPIPALDILAGGAVQFDMIAELARVHGLELSAGPGPQPGRPDGPVGAQAGADRGRHVADRRHLQANAGRLRGRRGRAGGDHGLPDPGLRQGVHRLLPRGAVLGPEGINGVLLRQFDLNSRTEFLQDFATHVVQSVLRKVPAVSSAIPTAIERKGDR